jgi:small glutamine-rich tetratricopeptide repeat-containing protein alpha
MATKGLFSGLAIGSSDYQNALKGLATQYQTKFTLSESPMGSDAISPMDKQRADVLKSEGNNLLSKDTKGAISKYSQAIVLDPSNHIYWANRAVAYYKLGKFTEAVDDCKQAIAIEPKYTKAHYRLGQSYAAQRSYTEAVEAYTKAIEVSKQVGDNAIRGEIQRELDSIKSKVKPVVAKKNAPRGGAGAAGAGGLNLGALMGNPEVQAMLSNPNLMESLGSMLGGGDNGKVDLSALQGMLGGAGGAGGPSADSLANIVEQVQGDPSVEALNDDEQMAAIMAEIERDGPMSAMKYLQDPTVMAKIGPLVQKFMGGMKK